MGGVSRGSYLILDKDGSVPAEGLRQYAFKKGKDPLSSKICMVKVNSELDISFSWRDVNPLPQEDQWFETVWKEYREGEIFR